MIANSNWEDVCRVFVYIKSVLVLVLISAWGEITSCDSTATFGTNARAPSHCS